MSKIRRKGAAIVDTSKGILVVAGRSKRFILPGGGANKGESRKKASIRELYEETGLKTKKIKYLFSYIGGKWHTHSGRSVRNHAKVFLVDAIGKPRPRHEIRFIDYWNPGAKIHITSGTRKVIEKYIIIKNKKNKYI